MRRIFFVTLSFLLFFSCQNNNPAVLKNTVEKPIQKTIKKEKKQFDENKVYKSYEVEIKPDYPGGMDKLYAFLKKNFVLPKEVIENDIQGQPVFASFNIEKDGSLSDIKIIRDFGLGAGEEFERVLKLCPKWIPGKIDGTPVKCLYTIPYYISVD
jgi:hypothetical protein